MAKISDEELMRLNVEIPKSLHERIKQSIPWGLKADIVRRLLEMVDDSVRQYGVEFIIHLHQGKIKLTYTDGHNKDNSV